MKKLTLTLIMIVVFVTMITVLTAETYSLGKIQVTKTAGDSIMVYYPIGNGPSFSKEDAQRNSLGNFAWNQCQEAIGNTPPVVWVFGSDKFIDATINVAQKRIEFSCLFSDIKDKTWNIVFFCPDANYWVHAYKYTKTQYGFNVNERGGALTLKEPMK